MNGRRKPGLNELIVVHDKVYDDLFVLMKTANIFERKDGKIVFSKAICELKSIIVNLVNDAAAYVKEIDIKHAAWHESIIVYVKIKMLYAIIAQSLKEADIVRCQHEDVIFFLVTRIRKLNYKNDIEFQRHMQKLLIEYKYPSDNSSVKSGVRKAANKILPIFQKNCGDTIVKLSLDYHELMVLGCRFKTDLLKEKRENLLTSGRTLTRMFANMKEKNNLTTEMQLYYLEMNYYLLSVSEAFHIWSVWEITGSNGKFTLEFNKSCPQMELYFNYWITLRDNYITTSMSVLNKLNMDEINHSLRLYLKLYNILEQWFPELLMCLDIFEETTDIKLKEIDPSRTISDEEKLKRTEFIFKLENENKLLAENIKIVTGIMNKCILKFPNQYLDKAEEIMKRCCTLQQKIGLLREESEKNEKEKLECSRKIAAEIEREAEADREEKAKKYKARHAIKAFISFNDDDSNDADEDEDENESESANVEILSVINPELRQLENLDLTFIRVAQPLNSKAEKLRKRLEARKNSTNVIFSLYQQIKTHQTINTLLLEYYYLVSLFEKYEKLSNQGEIIKMSDLQDGIEMGRTELKKTLPSIDDTIKKIQELFMDLLLLQKASKSRTIYSIGKKYMIDHGLPNQTYEAIMKHGKREFINIGKKKLARNQELSEYAQQKDFLDLFILALSGFDFLQKKIQNYMNADTQTNICQFTHFQLMNNSVEMCSGRLEGIIGLILKDEYRRSGDITYLKNSHIHLLNSYNYYKEQKNDGAVNGISIHLTDINKILCPDEHYVGTHENCLINQDVSLQEALSATKQSRF